MRPKNYAAFDYRSMREGTPGWKFFHHSGEPGKREESTR
ncbi:hypothetical protein Amir_7021 [Actinosynnema mirum DSM 43827]|uniref:Uncharacterized protein n=1 Tax=Actinosynnema mirum (strain ATCC 29888 / DSM 43827 / JCM 3225 / NBRC 14064 / NCIMB 13271 / NRRL B-12336 / IMRU 3971 / 101) TaxID=446462 RepID=C6WSE3_ACTMD|nr:hypothetical protein Amir_7021 [Actinosynnema mirum DSM 43827]